MTTGPLDGIRVIEVGTLISGPFAGRLLGDMGAEVIKIEPPGAPDPLRTWGQAELDGHHFFWTVHARNKKAVTLNLRETAGRDLFLDLVERSDIIVENFRPGTLEKWGLGYDALKARNKGIILVRVSGYGQTGPEAHKAGYASVAEAASGLRHMNGFPGGPPPRLALSLGDSLAGMFAAQGAMAALYRRTVTGEGQIVDAALTESCLAVQESTIPDYDVGGVVRGPSGTRLEGIAPSNIYPTADGSWVVIAANQDTVFRRLCAAMGQPELATDDRFANHVARGRNQDELDKIIGDWASERSPDDIISTLSRGRRDQRADQHGGRSRAGPAAARPRDDRRPLRRTDRPKRAGARCGAGAYRRAREPSASRVRRGPVSTTTRCTAGCSAGPRPSWTSLKEGASYERATDTCRHSRCLAARRSADRRSDPVGRQARTARRGRGHRGAGDGGDGIRLPVESARPRRCRRTRRGACELRRHRVLRPRREPERSEAGDRGRPAFHRIRGVRG